MMLCTGCYETQEYGIQLYEQDAHDELECLHDEGNVSDAMTVHLEDEEHVDDESTYPKTEESIVIKHNSDISELWRKCRRKVVNGVKCNSCTRGYHWKCGGITKD